MNNISIYLLIGLLLAIPAVCKPNKYTVSLIIAFWFVIFCTSLGLIRFFDYQAITWSKSLAIKFSYQIDGLARLFALLISGIGLLIFSYVPVYTQGVKTKQAKLMGLLQIFAISMLTIVLTDNLIVLFLAWELTTVTSYLLIQFDPSDKAANQAAFNGMFISVLGGLAMLAGFILIQLSTNSWSIQAALQARSMDHQLLLPIFWLLLLGAVTKSAQFPFYFWLPAAMKAPTPVSAYLHSATMVNAGIYLLARFHPLLGDLSQWYNALSYIGLVTMCVAGVLSLCQRDLKAILAYTTLFILGSMVYLLASNIWLSAEALAVLLLFHGLYKAAAFMWVGTIDKTMGTRDIMQLRGLGRYWLSASIVAVISFSAMAGLPPFFGFAVKEMIYDAKLASGSISYLFMTLGMLSSMCVAAASIKCLYYWFTGPMTEFKQTRLRYGLVAPLILVMVILVLDVLNPHFANLLSKTANTIIGPKPADQSINNYAGSLLSLATVLGGVLISFISIKFNTAQWSWPACLNPRVIFERGLATVLYWGRWFTYVTQRQAIRRQLMLMLSCLALGLLAACYVVPGHILTPHWHSTTVLNSLLSSLLIILGLSILLVYRFLLNMISFALFGLTMSAVFVLQGAPDVAMTQLLVEILTVIILVIALRKADLNYTQRSNLRQKITHGMVALVIGLTITYLLFMVLAQPFNQSISQYYLTHSVPLAYGRNVVNVILVDFRAFDTFGEALVIFATALAIWLLIDKINNKQRETN